MKGKKSETSNKDETKKREENYKKNQRKAGKSILKEEKTKKK